MRAVPILTASLLIAAGCGSESSSTGDPIEPTETTVTGPPSTPADPTDPDQGGGADTAAPTSTAAEPATTATVPPTSDPETTLAPTTSTTPVDGAATTREQLAQVAIDDLMTRVGAERDEIGIRSVDEVTWRDGAIGCPDPDFAYTQALVPGIRVVLDHEGFAYHYHQGGGRELFYCPTPEAPTEDPAGDE